MTNSIKQNHHSPCTGGCHPKSDYCSKCGRSFEEIANWLTYSKEEKKQIIKEAKKRKNIDK